MLSFGCSTALLFATAVLAAILANTDAASGKAVVPNEPVPDEVRQNLNVENGLNDGTSVPVFLIFLAMGPATAGDDSPFRLALCPVVEESCPLADQSRE